MKHCDHCPCRLHTEHCDDYLLLLQELLDAEAMIEKLRFEIDCLLQNKDSDM